MDVVTFETPKERDVVSDFVGALDGEIFTTHLFFSLTVFKRFGPWHGFSVHFSAGWFDGVAQFQSSKPTGKGGWRVRVT